MREKNSIGRQKNTVGWMGHDVRSGRRKEDRVNDAVSSGEEGGPNLMKKKNWRIKREKWMAERTLLIFFSSGN